MGKITGVDKPMRANLIKIVGNFPTSHSCSVLDYCVIITSYSL